jgi:hypothetical protein
MPDAGHSYTPTGRSVVFNVPAYADVADLRALFQLFADTSAGLYEAPVAVSTANRPASPFTNQLIFDTTLHQIMYWSGSEWVQVTGSSSGGASFGDIFLLMGA